MCIMPTEEMRLSMNKELFYKVPAITIGFWIIKIFATTLGETAGDTFSMSLDLGYFLSTAIFLLLLFAVIFVQVRSDRFHPAIYWTTILISTTAGTTLADFATRSLGIGYTGGSALLLSLVLLTLYLWKKNVGHISTDDISDKKTEIFYWVTITFSQTLGTALGDWTADTNGMGYDGAALLFAALLLIVTALYYAIRINRAVLFWAAFILTRPLGAAVGDFIDKPVEKGGLDFSRPLASAVLAGIIIALVLLVPQRAKSAKHNT